MVASEVKSLASQTAKATEDISAQVVAMQDATADAVQAIESIGGTIGSINEIATMIASAVEEQGSATREIARNVQEAAQGTGEVSSNIVGVNEAAGETGAAATQVLASAEQLSGQAATLRADVDRFPRKHPRGITPLAIRSGLRTLSVCSDRRFCPAWSVLPRSSHKNKL